MNNQNSLFEKEEKKEMVYKFPDEEGILNLNGVEVRYTFKNEYFGYVGSPPHIDFNSVIERTPNPITETGYRSHFFYQDELNDFNTFKEYLDQVVKDSINAQNKHLGRKEVKEDKTQATLF